MAVAQKHEAPSFINKPAQDLAEFAAGLRFEDVPAPVIERAKLLILDSLGVGLAANAYNFAGTSLKGIAALGGTGSSTVIGRNERLPLRDAALANGILIHGLDFDDTHLGSIIHAKRDPVVRHTERPVTLDLNGCDFIGNRLGNGVCRG